MEDNNKHELTPHEPRFKTKQAREKYLGALRHGFRHMEACRFAGASPKTIYNHRRNDPDFAQECADAEAVACDLVEAELMKNVLKGNLGAQIFWLLNRSQDRWSNKSYRGVQGPQANQQDEVMTKILGRLEEHLSSQPKTLINLDFKNCSDYGGKIGANSLPHRERNPDGTFKTETNG